MSRRNSSCSSSSDSGWSTITDTSSPTSPATSPTVSTAHRSRHEHRQPKDKESKERKEHKDRDKEKHRSRRHNRPREDTLQVYLDEQRKLFEHLERRYETFNQEWRQRYQTAKADKQAAKNRQAKQNLVQSGELKKAKKPTPAVQPQVQNQQPRLKSRPPPSQAAQANKDNRTPPPVPPRPLQSPKPASTMIGPLTSAAARSSPNVARQVLPAAATAAAAGSSSSRSFSSSTPRAARASKKPPVNPEALSTFQAARVLRALETPNPSAAYSLTINTRYSKSSLPLRGRVSLPLDCRKAPEVILVFAEPDSSSAQAALSAGANFVGGEELFPRVLSGEVAPTKCLSTPGMLPAVQKSLARFLGPKGLMPAAKRGGVGEGEELAHKVREAGGLMEWKADKLGVVRAPVARMHFALPAVEANIRAMVQAVREGSIAAASSETNTASKSKRVSGITSVRLESTQGPSIELNDVV